MREIRTSGSARGAEALPRRLLYRLKIFLSAEMVRNADESPARSFIAAVADLTG